jgi:uncharacterized protein YjdB
MRRILFLLLLLATTTVIIAQTTLTLEGNVYNNTSTGTWEGVNIMRSVPTALTFRNNSITSVNSTGYLLQAGDENPAGSNNNLDDAIITGNMLIWNGTDLKSDTHGLFTGYNINVVMKYNYIYRAPLGLIRKSNGMSNTSGGVAYNIVKSPLGVAAVAKGIRGVCFYNNTFYSDQAVYGGPGIGTWRGLVDVYSNTDNGLNSPSTGTKIKNNIFYTKNLIYNIYIYDAACLTGFESDYNIFYCESGTPVFNYLGTRKTFAQWQALGYDLHSVVINPNFKDFTDFVPNARLDYGTDLGATWQKGLSVDAIWSTSDPKTTSQNGTWQVGARIYSSDVVPVTEISVRGAGGATTISSDKGSLQLNASVLPANATDMTVVWSVVNGTGHATITPTGQITAIDNGTVTARATANDGSGVYGTLLVTISNQIIPVTGLNVTGTGGLVSISSDNGTLQLSAEVLPVNATNKNVTWSLVNNSVLATISPTGLVTAIDNGTVTARATAADGSGVYGNLIITISKQINLITGIIIAGAGSLSVITSDKGTLQLTETVSPSNATDKSVTWSVINGTGQAVISSGGIVTAIANGSVTAKAMANDGSGIFSTYSIAITNQIQKITGITVTGSGGLSAINIDNGTLQLIESVLPENATNKSVIWSVVNGSGLATISPTGLLTAIDNGIVTVRAFANDGSGVYGTMVVSISNQIITVTGITVTGAGGMSSISTNAGTLLLSALVLPSNTSNKNITWSVVNGTGDATINSMGLVTAVSNGTVTAVATANDGSGIQGTLNIIISNQIIPVTGIIVAAAGGISSISSDDGTLQLSATVLPSNATNQSVTWSVINNTGSASISSTGLLTALDNGIVTAKAAANDGSGILGVIVITISNQVILLSGIIVTGQSGASIITTPGGSLQLNAAVLPSNATDKTVTWTIIPGTGQASINATGLVTAIADGLITAVATANDGSGTSGIMIIKISVALIPVISIALSGEAGASAISTDNGTLQLNADILPADATEKTVIWSVTNGTGSATITPTGLIAAVDNGTVTARATSTDGSGVFGAMIITISNQLLPVTGITVLGAGGETVITTDNGSLQMSAILLPADATVSTVTWSVVNNTGSASISSSGLVTAVRNGSVTVIASANDGSGVFGTLILTISNQIIPVTGISISGTGGISAITSDKGSLQLIETVSPADATNMTITWSIENGTGQAGINSTGLITAVASGTVTAKATANDGSGISGTITIAISNQIVPVTGITVTGQGGVNSITTDNGTLQLNEIVLPADAGNKTVIWSIINGSNLATINNAGLLTAVANGTITVRASANDGSGIYGTMVINISNQFTPISSITVTGANNASTIGTDNGSLLLSASILPSNATDKTVTWTLVNGTGQAVINTAGNVTAVDNGNVTVIATANDGSGVSGSITITISNQTIPVTGISLSGQNGITSISLDKGQLQIIATVLPLNASHQSVTWSVSNVTGQANISGSGLLTAAGNGTVTVRATAVDGSGIFGTITISISNQVVQVSAITVSGSGGASIITADKGSLQMVAVISPANANNKTVTWSIANGTGKATITPGGLVTAFENGVVTVSAAAIDGSGIVGHLIVSIYNQIILASGLSVTGTGGSTSITINNGSLQLSATVIPSNTTDKSVTWSLTNGTGRAIISTDGLVTALDNGTVTARATTKDGSSISGTLVISISNQTGPVTSIMVTGAGGSSSITTDNGYLQLNAAVLPANATVKTVTWSFVDNTGVASINSSGLVTAVSNGIISARASANDGSGVFGTFLITITNQIVPVSAVSITSPGGLSSITTDNGTLQLSAAVQPSFASDRTVIWSLLNGTGEATINSSGLVTSISNGTVTALATAHDGSGIYASMNLVITNQIVQITGITLSGNDGRTTVDAYHGTLQISAVVLPQNSSNITLTWSLLNDTSIADINSNGLLTANGNGTVTVVATASDGSNVYGTIDITLTGQIIPVASISISGTNGDNAITGNKRNLQLRADIFPVNATDKSVTWSVVSGLKSAVINSEGLVTAIDKGSVIIKAAANDGSGIFDLIEIPIDLESTELTSIVVTRDEMRIQLNSNYLSWNLSLHNLQGSLLFSKPVDSDLTVINISNLPSGIIIVSLSKGELLKVAKTIKP